MSDKNTTQGVPSIEIERKYDVTEQEQLPLNLDALGLKLEKQSLFNLEATYFDTSNNDLQAKRVALRRRVGGEDAGWHIKTRNGHVVEELAWPAEREMPTALKQHLDERYHIDGSQLTAVVTLKTRRLQFYFVDEAGGQVLYLVDDHVFAADRQRNTEEHWREWECELAPGADEGLLDSVERILLAAGAEVSKHSSKIARARGVSGGSKLFSLE